MKDLIHKIIKHPVIEDFSNGKASFAHLSPTQEALLIASSYLNKPRPIVIVKSNLYQAQQLYDKIQFWLEDKIVLFPVEESLRVEAIAASPEINAIRMESLSRLSEEKDLICVTHVGAAIRYYPRPSFYRENRVHLKIGQNIQMAQLKQSLRYLGYTEVTKVDQPSCFATRGEIVDVYPINQNEPIRIEFFDQEIESIRIFDLSTQRTLSKLDEILIHPCSDLIFSDQEIFELEENIHNQLRKEAQLKKMDAHAQLVEHVENDLDYIKARVKENHLYRYRSLLKQTGHLFQYFDHPTIILSSTEDVDEHIKRLQEETLDYLVELSQNNQAFAIFDVFNHLYEIMAGYKRVDFRRFETKSSHQRLPFRELDVPQESLFIHAKNLKVEAEKKLVVCCLKEHEIKQLLPMLVDFKVPYSIRLKPNMETGLVILHQDLDDGFEFLEPQIRVYGSKELFNHAVHIGRYNSKFKEAESLHSYQELEAGDYVVHHQYGVGQYLGIITKEIQGNHRDFLHIVYRNNSSLYVPLEQFQLVRKFVSREGVVPKLHTLGSNDWKKTKAKIKESVKDIAERLINLYGEREHEIAYQFGEDTSMQKEFEAEFEYPLTHDQAVAIEDVKRDMMQAKPMDRLLCGDVGFGKTEVALRAAFKAVSEKKQVAFLCPTTVLSQQHFRTFLNRLENYPVNVAVLNRYVPESHQREIIKAVKEGRIDILIGTHRILSKDIGFKDLGLLVIDEEQRFGVEHKEKIKEVRRTVHVLSLSATPIPRTLQMSLVGVRALSQLDTPPLNRLPVLTYVIEKNKAVIRDVIQRELSRSGQVFYLYNNVSEIHNIALSLEKEIPDAKVAVAHGQMHRDDIEDVMLKFNRNEVNVLVCTTIVETGIDIPNANTILIDQADTFGLSQLYQIKGRVGRSSRLAYAYLMYNPRKQLSEIAQKRLQSIKEFTELGSGYKIAMRDLTIRGAGEMLGDQQSGFIDTVGMDMYIEMLHQAIEEKRTGIIVEEAEPEIRQTIQIDGYIPKQFEPKDFEKLSLYQRIEAAKNEAQLSELLLETQDLYGKLPKSVILLFEKKRWELLLKAPFVQSFRELKQELQLVFSSDWSSKIDGVKFFEMVSRVSADVKLKYTGGNIVVLIPKHEDWLFTATAILDKTQNLPLKRSH